MTDSPSSNSLAHRFTHGGEDAHRVLEDGDREIERLTRERDSAREALRISEQRVREHWPERDRLRAALEFYADKDNYGLRRETDKFGIVSTWPSRMDQGERARQALAGAPDTSGESHGR